MPRAGEAEIGDLQGSQVSQSSLLGELQASERLRQKHGHPQLSSGLYTLPHACMHAQRNVFSPVSNAASNLAA